VSLPGSSRDTIARREIWSEVAPWRGSDGHERWVIASDATLDAVLRVDGIAVHPFERPSEYVQWTPPRQQLFDLVASYCQLNPSTTVPSASDRATSLIPALDERFAPVGGPRYSGYYLPYFAVDSVFVAELRELGHE
jgi:hypothetical protein